MKFRITLLFILAMVLTACGNTSSSESTPTPIPTPIVPSKPVYEIQRGDIVKEIEFFGRISPVEEKELFFRESGFVKNVFVSKGDIVAAGQVIADLENLSDLERQKSLSQFQVRLAELDLADVQLDLELFELSLPDPETLQAEALQAVFEAETALKDAQSAYNSTQTTASQISIDAAFAEMVLSGEELARAREAFEPYADKPDTNLTKANLRSVLAAAQQEYDAAVRYYNSLTSISNELDQSLAEANLAVAQITFSNAQFEYERVQEDPYPIGYLQELAVKQNALERAQINVDIIRLDVEDLDDAIKDSQIVAPFEGQILFLGVNEGRTIEAFEPAFVIADTESLQVRAELSGAELNGLTEGMPVLVELFNAPGDPVEGTILQLPTFSTPSDDASQEADPFTRIDLAVPLADSGFELNDRVRVRVILEQKTDVLWVPPQGVRSFEGRTFVVIQEADGQRRIDIKLGLETGDRVEILLVEGVENVTEGQLVVGP